MFTNLFYVNADILSKERIEDIRSIRKIIYSAFLLDYSSLRLSEMTSSIVRIIIRLIVVYLATPGLA